MEDVLTPEISIYASEKVLYISAFQLAIHTLKVFLEEGTDG